MNLTFYYDANCSQIIPISDFNTNKIFNETKYDISCNHTDYTNDIQQVHETQCEYVIIQNFENHKNQLFQQDAIIIDECIFDENTDHYFTAQCNTTHYWYMECNNNKCNVNNNCIYHARNSSSYKVIHCSKSTNTTSDSSTPVTTINYNIGNLNTTMDLVPDYDLTEIPPANYTPITYTPVTSTPVTDSFDSGKIATSTFVTTDNRNNKSISFDSISAGSNKVVKQHAVFNHTKQYYLALNIFSILLITLTIVIALILIFVFLRKMCNQKHYEHIRNTYDIDKNCNQNNNNKNHNDEIVKIDMNSSSVFNTPQ